LWKTFGPKRDEVTGEWRGQHNEKLYDLYCSLNIIQVVKSRRMRWVGHVVHKGGRRAAYRVLTGSPKGRRPFGRFRHRWDDNIKMELQEVGWRDTDWNALAQDRGRWQALVHAVMNLHADGLKGLCSMVLQRSHVVTKCYMKHFSYDKNYKYHDSANLEFWQI